MMMPVLCSNCNDQPNGITIDLEFRLDSKSCPSCHHLDVKSWKYWFCDRICMVAWLKKYDVENKGFPCKDCTNFGQEEPTGFAFGFKENGTCESCHGNKSVK